MQAQNRLKIISEGLKQARHLIDNPERWTQGTQARDHRGKPCPPESNQAAQWSALGALYATYAVEEDIREALLALVTSRQHLIAINDRQGHEAVLALFDQAIAALYAGDELSQQWLEKKRGDDAEEEDQN